MPLPCSKSHADRIGKRLAREEATGQDWDDLAEILAVYDEAKEAVLGVLREAGIPATGRTKNTGTLLEKLRRSTSLKSVQDIAGVRVLVDGGRDLQDEIARRVAALFGGWEAGDFVDRRARPSNGYRAVHYIVRHEDLPVEVQIRTPLQHSWAEVIEGLADKWGRGIRYGDGPPDPSRPIAAGVDMTRSDFWAQCLEVSDAIDVIEEAERYLDPTDTEVWLSFQEWEASVREWFDSVATLSQYVAPYGEGG